MGLLSSIADAQRDGGGDAPAALIAEYDRGAAAVRSAVEGLTAEQLRARPVAGRWSMLELICHVADCEQFFADRMKRTIAMDRPLLIGADGFRYPGSLRYHDHDLEEEIRLVEITRLQMARVLRLLPPEAWQRTAIHSETGLVTLRQLLLHANRHLAHHLVFAGEKRNALGLGTAMMGFHA